MSQCKKNLKISASANEILHDITLNVVLNPFEGVFLASAKNAFVPVKRDNSVNTYYTHIQEFQLSHEGVSEVSEQAREPSERAK